IPNDEYLLNDFGCALQKEILLQGRIYVSVNHICFHANILGWVTDVVMPFSEITRIEKKTTAIVIPNAIQITTVKSK
ncbi:7305_t:CDS:2, partial [Dentiscutata heterogama]